VDPQRPLPTQHDRLGTASRLATAGWRTGGAQALDTCVPIRRLRGAVLKRRRSRRRRIHGQLRACACPGSCPQPRQPRQWRGGKGQEAAHRPAGCSVAARVCCAVLHLPARRVESLSSVCNVDLESSGHSPCPWSWNHAPPALHMYIP
jgi:hypothetical protein